MKPKFPGSEFLSDENGELEQVTIDKLPSYINSLIEKKEELGLCEIIALAAAAAAMSVDNSRHGGISGYMQGEVTWRFIRLWNPMALGECGARILNMDNMLYPQYEEYFRTIPRSTWEALQKQASENLSERKDDARPDVVRHWKSIVDGKVPFGYKVGV